MQVVQMYLQQCMTTSNSFGKDVFDFARKAFKAKSYFAIGDLDKLISILDYTTVRGTMDYKLLYVMDLKDWSQIDSELTSKMLSAYDSLLTILYNKFQDNTRNLK